MARAQMYARLAHSAGSGTGLYRRMRLGATRQNFYGPKHLLKVNNDVRTNNFDKLSWEVVDNGRGQGKTLRIEVFGFTPAVTDEILLGAGSFSNRLFRGTIVRVRRVHHKLNEGRAVYQCQCVDWTYRLNNPKVTTKYENASATDIAKDLIASFAPAGFTSVHVQTGLTTLDSFQVTMQSLPSALQQLAERIGGGFYIDSDLDLHLYVGSDTSGINPEAITASNPHIQGEQGFSYETDIENLRNQVIVEAQGSTVTCAVPVGRTAVPVQDSSPFGQTATTHHAKLEALRITYTGVAAVDQEGCLTAGTPGSAPNSPSPFHATPYVTGNLQHTSGSGVELYRYKVTFVSALGESDASAPVSANIAQVPWGFSDGPSGVTGTTGGSLVSGGFYYWAVTFVTSSGEVGHVFFGSSGWNLGTGNTRADLTGIPVSSDPRVTSRKLYRTVNGGTGDFKLVATIGDNVTTTYSDTTADGSLGASAPTTDTGSTGRMTVGIPLGPTGTTSRKLYRTELSGSTYKLQSTTADNTTTSLTDNTADGSLGATFSGSTLGASPGDTTLLVTDLSKFPSSGYVRAGSQVLFYTGVAAASGQGNLTGIPASGEGAILAPIPAGSTVLGEPHLTGVPSSGFGSVATVIPVSASINPLAIADDLTSQGAYGARQDYVQQRGFSLDTALEYAEARLELLANPRVSGSMTTSDPKVAAGRPITINHATWGLTASVTAQTVTIRPVADRPQPLVSADFATRSLEDLYMQLRDLRERLARTS